MAMEISNNYSSYASSYMNTTGQQEKTTESRTTKETTESNAAAAGKSSASAGMSYLQSLQKAYSGTLFMAGTVSYGQTYGNSSQIAFVVNPSYVSKLGTDSEARSQFEEAVEYLYNFSQNFRAQQAANGWEVISDGWFCDENGNWGGWCATRKTDEKSFLQKMQEKSDEIMKEKMEKCQELKELEEKHEAEKAEFKAQMEKPLKEQFGDKWKGIIVIDKDDDNPAFPKSDKDNAKVVGLHMNVKV